MVGSIKIGFINDNGSGSLAQLFVERVVAAEALGTVQHLTIQQVLDGALDNGGYHVVFNARHVGGPNGDSETDAAGNTFTRVPAAFREALDRAHAAGVGFITEWQGGSPVWTTIGSDRKHDLMTETNGDLWKWYQGTVDRGDCGWATSGCVPITFSTTDASHPVMQGLAASFAVPHAEFCYRVQNPDASLAVLATLTENGGTVRPAILAGTRGRGRVVLWACDWGDNQVEPSSGRPADPNVEKWVANSIRWAAVPVATTPSAPTITAITAGDGQLTVEFTPPSSDGGAAITNYEYSTDRGVLWTARAPASTANPIVITDLSNATEYHVTIRAVNSVGAGAQSNTVSATSGSESTEVVPANQPATVTVEDSCDAEADGQCAVAGVDIPENTFSENVTVSVRFVRLENGEKCHDHLLAQNNLCVEVDVRDERNNEPTLNNNVIVGFCLPTSVEDLEMYKFETRSSRPKPLRQVTAEFLECDGFQTSSAKPSNWLHGLALGVSKQVGKWISPELAFAADRGFGGEVEKDDGFSFFTWAAPLQLTNAGLAVNFFNSGKDAFGVSGVFGLDAKGFEPFSTEEGFNPALHPVTVLYGDHEETLAAGGWRSRGNRWEYVSSAPIGVNYVQIDTRTSEVVVAGRVPTGSDAFPKYRQFTIRLGNRIRGLGLLCGTSGRCTGQH